MVKQEKTIKKILSIIRLEWCLLRIDLGEVLKMVRTCETKIKDSLLRRVPEMEEVLWRERVNKTCRKISRKFLDMTWNILTYG